MERKDIKSFGIIPIFKSSEGFYVLIVKNLKGGHWGLPKGTPEENEKPLDTAKRELYEETGISDINIKEDVVFEEKYDFEQNNILYNKTNGYYPGFVSEMNISDKLDGIDEIKWIKINEAKNTLTHQSAINVIDKLRDWLNNTPKSPLPNRF
jgi:8-oxo-dGTP pyrophosphatase MutT (NUDIX family)